MGAQHVPDYCAFPGAAFRFVKGRCESCVAVKDDGSAVAWGHPQAGGDTSGVDLSSGVVSAMCGGYACVAVKADGSAVAWGDPARGGDVRPSSAFSGGADLSSGVATAMCGWEACVAAKQDTSAVAWGYKSAGGDAAGTSMLPDIITADITSGVIAAAAGEDAKR